MGFFKKFFHKPFRAVSGGVESVVRRGVLPAVVQEAARVVAQAGHATHVGPVEQVGQAVEHAAQQVGHVVERVAEPVGQAVEHAAQQVSHIVQQATAPVTKLAETITAPVVRPVAKFLAPVLGPINGVLEPVNRVLRPVEAVLQIATTVTGAATIEQGLRAAAKQAFREHVVRPIVYAPAEEVLSHYTSLRSLQLAVTAPIAPILETASHAIALRQSAERLIDQARDPSTLLNAILHNAGASASISSSSNDTLLTAEEAFQQKLLHIEHWLCDQIEKAEQENSEAKNEAMEKELERRVRKEIDIENRMPMLMPDGIEYILERRKILKEEATMCRLEKLRHMDAMEEARHQQDALYLQKTRQPLHNTALAAEEESHRQNLKRINDSTCRRLEQVRQIEAAAFREFIRIKIQRGPISLPFLERHRIEQEKERKVEEITRKAYAAVLELRRQRVIAATQRERSAHHAFDVAHSYGAAAYAQAIIQGSSDAIKGLAHTILHPVDDLLLPFCNMLRDTAIIAARDTDIPAAAQTDLFTGVDLSLLREEIRRNPSLYYNAKDRIDQCVEDIREIYPYFTHASGPQRARMISEVATSVLLPGYAARFAKSVNTFRRFGQFSLTHYHPYDPEFAALGMQGRRLDILSRETIQRYADRAHDPLMYVIERDGRLIITEQHYDHAHLGSGHPVLAAGDVYVENGKITRVDNRSGSYTPQGEHLQRLIERTFEKAGFPEVVGKYVDHDLEVAQFRSGPAHTPITTRESLVAPSVSGSVTGALQEAASRGQSSQENQAASSSQSRTEFFRSAPSTARVRAVKPSDCPSSSLFSIARNVTQPRTPTPVNQGSPQARRSP